MIVPTGIIIPDRAVDRALSSSLNHILAMRLIEFMINGPTRQKMNVPNSRSQKESLKKDRTRIQPPTSSMIAVKYIT